MLSYENHEDVCSQVEEVREKLLELTGETMKLGILVAEIPESQLRYIENRYRSFVAMVENLPIQLTPSECNSPGGQA